MKCLSIIIVVLLSSVIVKAQDFSYLKEIDINDKAQLQEAKEAAMECCCYLTAVRYDKKDEQRLFATEFVSNWLNAISDAKKIVDERIVQIVNESSDLEEMYVIYYAMTIIDGDDDMNSTEVKQGALLGVYNYCSNSSNKLKLTKELKQVKELYDSGELAAYLNASALTSSIE